MKRLFFDARQMDSQLIFPNAKSFEIRLEEDRVDIENNYELIEGKAVLGYYYDGVEVEVDETQLPVVREFVRRFEKFLEMLTNLDGGSSEYISYKIGERSKNPEFEQIDRAVSSIKYQFAEFEKYWGGDKAHFLKL